MIKKARTVSSFTAFTLGAFTFLALASPQAAEDSAKPEMPKIKRMQNDGVEFYPLDLRQKKVTGKVALVFSINAKGQAFDAQAISGDDKNFAIPAAQILKRLAFRVPKDWQKSGGASIRYTMMFSFGIKRIPGTCEPSSFEGGEKELVICSRD